MLYGADVGLGLSPRVRGNHVLHGIDDSIEGSIPARAGEPESLGAGQTYIMVYPRACGGTSVADQGPMPWEGLSPRVRGNPC